jgi:hypothetical protein
MQEGRQLPNIRIASLTVHSDIGPSSELSTGTKRRGRVVDLQLVNEQREE